GCRRSLRAVLEDQRPLERLVIGRLQRVGDALEADRLRQRDRLLLGGAAGEQQDRIALELVDREQRAVHLPRALSIASAASPATCLSTVSAARISCSAISRAPSGVRLCSRPRGSRERRTETNCAPLPLSASTPIRKWVAGKWRV